MYRNRRNDIMKRIGSFLLDIVIGVWLIVAIFVTICLLSYNDFMVTTFGKTSLVIIDSDEMEPDFLEGDLLIIKRNSDSKINVGDKVFYYNSAMNIFPKYQKALSNEERQALSFCTQIADDMGIKIYLVGGIVRDILLGRKFNDIDILVEDDAILFGDILVKKYSKNVEILARNEKFKTLKLKFTFGKKSFEADLASTRSEVYEYPCALPILAETGVSLKKDIKRRDFAINALAMSLNSKNFCEIFDETENGLFDIENGLIRILHTDSFMDDPSRIVRGLKYRAKLNFALEEDTEILQAQCLASDKYTNDCQERIKKEVRETLNLLLPYCFDKFVSENIYKLIIGQTSKKDILNGNLLCKIIDSCLDFIDRENVWIIFLCIIFNFAPFELVGTNTEKLALKRKEQAIVTDFFLLKSELGILNKADTKFEIYEILNKYSPEAVVANLCLAKEPDLAEKYYLYLNKLKNINLSVSGKDIEKMGIENGVVYKEILTNTLREKINNNLSAEEEKKVFKDLCNLVKNKLTMSANE